MGLDKKTQKINGHEWKVTQFPARPANKYKVRILKMIGPALTEILPALGKLGDGDGDGAELLALAPTVMSRLAQHVDEDVLVGTMLDLMAQSLRDGDQITEQYFDVEFAGNDLELYQAIWFIIQVNYPDFIEWVGKRLTGLHPKTSPEASPKTMPSTSESSKE